MPRKNLFFLLLAIFCSFFENEAWAAHFENMVNLTLKIEDASFSFRVKQVSFNGKDIKLDEPDNFKPRKIYTDKLPPGRYILTWTTEKSATRWSAEPIVNNERILVLESGDTNVRINIKGDTITIY